MILKPVMTLLVLIGSFGFSQVIHSITSECKSLSVETSMDAQPIIRAINDYRSSEGLTIILVDPILNKLTQHKAGVYSNTKIWAHDVESNKSWVDTYSDCSYQYKNTHLGENLAVGYPKADDLMKAWIASPTHKANLDNPVWTRMGITQSNDSLNYYTVLLFME